MNAFSASPKSPHDQRRTLLRPAQSAAARVDPTRLHGFTLEMCEEAERLGAHSVWLTEHHLFDDDYIAQPLVFAAAIAARTRRVRIGTAIVIAPLALTRRDRRAVGARRRRLRRTARPGLGAGYRVPEYELYGVPAMGATPRRTTWCARCAGCTPRAA